MRPDDPAHAQHFTPRTEAPTVPSPKPLSSHQQHSNRTTRQSPAIDDGEREALLIRALIGAYDTFESESVRTYVTQALARAGIVKVEVEAGAKFDPRFHNAAPQKRTAPSPDAHRSVAATRRPGWRYDNGEVIETPQVIVYIWQDPG